MHILCGRSVKPSDADTILGLTEDDAVGNFITLWLFAFCLDISWVCVYLRVLETKRQSLGRTRTPWTEAKT